MAFLALLLFQLHLYLLAEARTIDVSRTSCNEQVNLDFAYLLYLNYDGDSLGHQNMCKYTVTTGNDDKKICVIVQKFYVSSAHANSPRVEYHTYLYTSTEDQAYTAGDYPEGKEWCTSPHSDTLIIVFKSKPGFGIDIRLKAHLKEVETYTDPHQDEGNSTPTIVVTVTVAVTLLVIFVIIIFVVRNTRSRASQRMAAFTYHAESPGNPHVQLRQYMTSSQRPQSHDGYQGLQSFAKHQVTHPDPMQAPYPVSHGPPQPVDPSAPPPSYIDVTSDQYSVTPSGYYQPEQLRTLNSVFDLLVPRC